MTATFRLIGIDPTLFAPLFALSDAELGALDAVRVTATESPGFPCRVSLEDASEGQELLLLPYLHQPAASPYRASGPIFVRRDASQRLLEPGEVPPYVTRRLISLRGYDTAHCIVEAGVHEGADVPAALAAMFGHSAVAYVHLHNARQGCFSCAALRMPE